MKKTIKILLGLLISFACKSQLLVPQYHTHQYFDSTRNEYTTTVEQMDSVLMPPDWPALATDLLNSNAFKFATDTFVVSSPYWSVMIQYLANVHGKASPGTLKGLILKCNIPFQQYHKDEINAVLRKNNFNIKL